MLKHVNSIITMANNLPVAKQQCRQSEMIKGSWKSCVKFKCERLLQVGRVHNIVVKSMLLWCRPYKGCTRAFISVGASSQRARPALIVALFASRVRRRSVAPLCPQASESVLLFEETGVVFRYNVSIIYKIETKIDTRWVRKLYCQLISILWHSV